MEALPLLRRLCALAGNASQLPNQKNGAGAEGPLQPPLQQLGTECLLQSEARLERRTGRHDHCWPPLRGTKANKTKPPPRRGQSAA